VPVGTDNADFYALNTLRFACGQFWTLEYVKCLGFEGRCPFYPRIAETKIGLGDLVPKKRDLQLDVMEVKLMRSDWSEAG